MKIAHFTFGDIANYLKENNIKFEEALQTQLVFYIDGKLISPIEIKHSQQNGIHILHINNTKQE